jgi:hypothetical protein
MMQRLFKCAFASGLAVAMGTPSCPSEAPEEHIALVQRFAKASDGETAVSNSLPSGCTTFYSTYCGVSWTSTPTHAELSDTFDKCCVNGGHAEKTCSSIAAEVFDKIMAKAESSNDLAAITTITKGCDELLQLAHAHDDWQAVHSPAPSGVNLKEVGELEKSLLKKHSHSPHSHSPHVHTPRPTASPTKKPTTPAPTPEVIGEWTITRRHPKSGNVRTETVCGRSLDSLSIGFRYSGFCNKHFGSAGQVVVNQFAKQRTWAWYCENQGPTEIVSYTFTAEPADGPCADTHNVADDSAAHEVSLMEREPSSGPQVSDECDSCVKRFSARGGCASLIQYEDVSKYFLEGEEQSCKKCKLEASQFCLTKEGHGDHYKYIVEATNDEANATALVKRAGKSSSEAQNLDQGVARKGSPPPPPPPPPLAGGQCCFWGWGCNDCCDLCPAGNEYAWVGHCGWSRRCSQTPMPTKQPTNTPTSTPTNHPTLTPTSQPTPRPTEPVMGSWTITRKCTRNGKTKIDHGVCGMSTDVLSIANKQGKFCAAMGQLTQVVVNQFGEERTWGWFCSEQCPTEIVGTPTFHSELPGGPCSEAHNSVDDGT